MKARLVKIGETKGFESLAHLFNGKILGINEILYKSIDNKVFQTNKNSIGSDAWTELSVVNLNIFNAINSFQSIDIYDEQEIKWYDDIPQHGVLCWCHDNHEGLKSIEVITQYNAGFEYKYLSDNEQFKNATPLTNDEIKRLFLRDDKN